MSVVSLLFLTLLAGAASPDGAATFKANCASCHGEKGRGDGPAAKALDPKPRDYREKFKHGEKRDQIFKTISKGIEGTGMVGFDWLTKEERWALVDHVLKLRKAK